MKSRRKVVIDCDPGIDDSLALMLALSMEEIQVAGITVVCGNCPTAMGAANAKKVLRHMDRLDIPDGGSGIFGEDAFGGAMFRYCPGTFDKPGPAGRAESGGFWADPGDCVHGRQFWEPGKLLASGRVQLLGGPGGGGRGV